MTITDTIPRNLCVINSKGLNKVVSNVLGRKREAILQVHKKICMEILICWRTFPLMLLERFNHESLLRGGGRQTQGNPRHPINFCTENLIQNKVTNYGKITGNERTLRKDWSEM